MHIRRCYLPIERTNIKDAVVCVSEPAVTMFRPLHLIIFNPDPSLYVCGIIDPANRIVMQASWSGTLPSSAFSQSQPMKLNIDMAVVHPTQRIKLKMLNRGLRLIVLEAAIEGYVDEPWSTEESTDC